MGVNLFFNVKKLKVRGKKINLSQRKICNFVGSWKGGIPISIKVNG
jgi:hypothetical protein